MRGDKTEGNPTVGSFSKRNWVRVESARLSISFSETNNSTSCPRSRKTSATAIPGNKCPPVPPHAMIAFIWYSPMPLNPWGDPHLQSAAFLVGRFQNRLPINIEKQTDPEQTRHQVGSAVADKRQRQTLVRQE